MRDRSKDGIEPVLRCIRRMLSDKPRDSMVGKARSGKGRLETDGSALVG